MKKWILYIISVLLSLSAHGQNCSILSKANNITPDKLCSPVTATWTVSYTGVTNAGTPVHIRFDWDNGTVETLPATETAPGVFEATAIITYTSAGNVCNYHPQATLMVNGVLCTSSSQEQIVTVWDDDDHNGGHMHINPVVYPVCFGNSANVRFQDLTQFNCVPPQERDNPNVNTRWIQWIYGTDITMTGAPVTVDGRTRTFPYRDNIITLTGPVTGSGVWSDVIFVADDKLVGQYFEVTLRNWNYCNPYDDPTIPGGPRDRENGDHPPVVTTARILIVPYPDATITPVEPMCANAPPVTLTAHDPGGTWTGSGVTGDIFDPSMAGPGNHVITYSVTNADGCNDDDQTVITVHPVPDATIIDYGIVCSTDPALVLQAHDPGGVWSGTGVVGNIFYPAVAGSGNHLVTYTITDANGCTDTDSTIITVATPDATITPVDTLCEDSPAVTLTAHDLGGVWSGPGVVGNQFIPALAGVGNHIIHYAILNTDCAASDTAVITVMALPSIIIDAPATLFLNSSPVAVTAYPTGGAWSGPGMTDNIFDPAEAGLGIHTITYSIPPESWGCAAQRSVSIEVILPPMPEADFEGTTSGCAPLTVQFVNKSKHGESYTWDFGDKQYSSEENPEHTYYVPGNYIVKLTVHNIAGESVRSGIITVYQNPSAIFDAYPTHVVNNEQIVIFYSYSYFADSWLWDFGDGTTSTEENPYHRYESPGSYTVTLLVTTSDGCIDSAAMETPVVVEWKEGTLKFPNVFKWNGTGPTGGEWTEGVHPSMDHVFRPFFENVIEYKLQIFNRWGMLIYESHELKKGWDGYFGNGNLAPQGVYVWKVSGRYADGDYFDMVGDVTFLH
ncbi:MAG: PKD domain-containing protein [Bacteroidales bacterium]|nr:PKD domain-containing protein [Bacteroidales bacterium]